MYNDQTKIALMFMLAVCLIACSSANNKPVMISFSIDSTAILFSGTGPAGLLQLRNTAGIDTAFSEVISVIELPDENDSTGVEQVCAGKLTVSDSTILFRPRKSFVRGKSYQVVSYLNARFGDTGMMLTGKLDHKLKPASVILNR